VAAARAGLAAGRARAHGARCVARTDALVRLRSLRAVRQRARCAGPPGRGLACRGTRGRAGCGDGADRITARARRSAGVAICRRAPRATPHDRAAHRWQRDTTRRRLPDCRPHRGRAVAARAAGRRAACADLRPRAVARRCHSAGRAAGAIAAGMHLPRCERGAHPQSAERDRRRTRRPARDTAAAAALRHLVRLVPAGVAATGERGADCRNAGTGSSGG